MSYHGYGANDYIERSNGIYNGSGLETSYQQSTRSMNYEGILGSSYQTKSMIAPMSSSDNNYQNLLQTSRYRSCAYDIQQRSTMCEFPIDHYDDYNRDIYPSQHMCNYHSVGEKKEGNMEMLINQVNSLPKAQDKKPARLDYKCNEKSTDRDIEVINQFLQDYGILALGDDMPNPIMSFDEAPFSPEIMSVIEEQKWQYPTEIQCITIPIALAGRDAIGVSKTGSGKTAAYIMPGIMHVKLQNIVGPTVLILVPTRELVEQIGKQISLFEDRIHLSHTCIYGGNGNRREQIAEIQRNPDIVVAVPGRLMDFLSHGILSISNVSYIVIDEADKMLEREFHKAVTAILGCCQPHRQILLWSATWPQLVRDLADEILDNPIRIVSKKSSVTVNKNIYQLVKRVTESDKFKILTDIIKNILEETKGNAKMVIFANRKETVDEIADFLNYGGIIRALATHAGKPTETRRFIINEFRTMERGACVGTNILARGLDISDITHVINYDFPSSVEDYVHRIGRTGRLIEGISLTLFTEADDMFAPALVDVLEKADQKIPQWLRDAAAFVTGRS